MGLQGWAEDVRWFYYELQGVVVSDKGDAAIIVVKQSRAQRETL